MEFSLLVSDALDHEEVLQRKVQPRPQTFLIKTVHTGCGNEHLSVHSTPGDSHA